MMHLQVVYGPSDEKPHDFYVHGVHPAMPHPSVRPFMIFKNG